MLVLSRLVGESITIGDGIEYPFVTVRVLSQRGGKVTIGVDAPREIRVVRTELLQGHEQQLANAG